MPSRKPGATEFTYKRTIQPQPKLGVWLPTLSEILEREAKLAEVGAARDRVDWRPPFACHGILRCRFFECAVEIDNRGRRGPLVTFGAVFRLSRWQGISLV